MVRHRAPAAFPTSLTTVRWRHTAIARCAVLVISEVPHYPLRVSRNTATRALRDGTLALHRETERHVRILDPDATTATYARFLSRMYGFHAALEDAFADHAALIATGFQPEARRKQGLLVADLHVLGVDALDYERCRTLPSVATLARALGAAYVVEGSTLGGAFVQSRLSPALKTTTRFLAGYGARTGEMWKAFGAIVDTQLADERSLAEAVGAARDTFACLITWLDEPGREPPQPYRGFEARP